MGPVYYKLPRDTAETVKVEYWNQPSFYEPFHYHEECQCTLITLSSGTVFVGNHVVEYREGDLFFMGKNLPHVLRHDEVQNIKKPGGVRAISVFFPINSILDMIKDVPEAYQVVKMLENSDFGFKFPGASKKEVGTLMEEIGKAIGFKRLLILFQIIQLFTNSSEKEQMTSTRPALLYPVQSKKLNKIFDHVMSHYHEKITLNEISSMVYMTPTAFCRFFKKHTQKSFSSFLIEIRINKACKMLQQDDYNVSDSCILSGYNNFSNFHRHFLRIMKLTPNEYKKQISRVEVSC